MAWSIQTWTAVVGAATAVASLIVMLTQRLVDARRTKILEDGVSLLRGAAEGYREEVRGLRNEISSLREQVGAVQLKKAQVAEQKERRLEADRKWKAAMDVLDRL